MKQQPVYISFLDLVFSLLGSVTILTVILSLTSGRSEHILDQDYIRVTVVWESHPEGGTYRSVLRDGSGQVLGRDSAADGWSFRADPTETGVGAEPTSVYYFSPARADTWRVTWDESTPPPVRVMVETKREVTTFTSFPSDRALTIETR